MERINFILCGLPSSGKTTIGKILGQKLGWDHIDTDSLIVKEYQHENISSCRELYFQKGEAAFRQIENRQILSLKNSKQTIISLGGGSLFYFDNLTLLKQLGYLIYLKSESAILWERIKIGGVPSYLNPRDPQNHFYQLMRERDLKLEGMADYIIDTLHLTPQEIAGQILFKLKRYYGK